jgi:hypothetical protein
MDDWVPECMLNPAGQREWQLFDAWLWALVAR